MALPANARLTLTVTLDDGPISGFPLQRRLTDESVTAWDTVRDADGDGVLSYTALPFTATAISELLVTAEYPVRVALNGQAQDGTTDLALQHNGMLVLFAANLTDATPVVVANPTDTPSCLHGLVAMTVT